MEREKLERRERDFENGRGRHRGEKKKKIFFSKTQHLDTTSYILWDYHSTFSKKIFLWNKTFFKRS